MLSKLLDRRNRQNQTTENPIFTRREPEEHPEAEEPPATGQTPVDSTAAQTPQPPPRRRKQHHSRGADFTLEYLSHSVIQVTHREHVGWFGINTDWDVLRPYAWTRHQSNVTNDGIHGEILWAETPDEALDSLCISMLTDQRKVDSGKINPEERKEAARQVLREMLRDMPDEITSEELQ